MDGRNQVFMHPLLYAPKAGEREIRMRPGKTLPLVRGREKEDGE